MTYRSSDFTAELQAVPDTNPPPCALDLDVVRSRGRALRRRRRNVGVGAGIAAAGLATALVFALAPHPGPSSAPSPPAGGARHSASAAHDPLFSFATFGWLPAGLRLSGAQPDHIVASNGSSEIDLTTYPAGTKPPQTCGAIPAGMNPNPAPGAPNSCDTTAPDVDGHKAYWAMPPGLLARQIGYVELDWEYAPNAWVLEDANIGTDVSDDIVATVYKVADSARFGPAAPIPLPFHIPSIPSEMKTFTMIWQAAPSAARGFQPRNDWMGADLMVGKPATKADNTTWGLEFTTQPSVSAFPSSGESEIGGTPEPAKDIRHLSIDGHQAIELNDASDGANQALVVHDVDGLDFKLTAYGANAIRDLDRMGGIVAYYHSIQIFGANPQDWTTDVLG